jgi:uncharacterized cupredoxin-like copper-binding protein
MLRGCACRRAVFARLTCRPGSRQGASREAAQLQPGAMHSLDVALVAPGAWQVVCRTANHYADGMTAIIDVASNGAPPNWPSRTRRRA